MDQLEIIVLANLDMLHSKYGDEALEIAHKHLDTHFPGTGTNAAERKLRHGGVRANQQMYLVKYVRDAGGREVPRGELEQALGYENPSHLSYDLRKVCERGELRQCARRGFYRLGKRYDS